MIKRAVLEYWSCGLPVSGRFHHIHLTQEGAELCEAKQEVDRRKQIARDIRKAKIAAKKEKEFLDRIEIERKLASTAHETFYGMKEDGVALVINRSVFTVEDFESAIKQGVFQDYHVGYKSVMEWFNGRE